MVHPMLIARNSQYRIQYHVHVEFTESVIKVIIPFNFTAFSNSPRTSTTELNQLDYSSCNLEKFC